MRPVLVARVYACHPANTKPAGGPARGRSQWAPAGWRLGSGRSSRRSRSLRIVTRDVLPPDRRGRRGAQREIRLALLRASERNRARSASRTIPEGLTLGFVLSELIPAVARNSVQIVHDFA